MPEAIISISIVTGNLPVVVPHLVSQGLFSLAHCPQQERKKIGWKSSRVREKSARTLINHCHTQSRFHVGKSTLWPIEIEPDSKKKKKDS